MKDIFSHSTLPVKLFTWSLSKTAPTVALRASKCLFSFFTQIRFPEAAMNGTGNYTAIFLLAVVLAFSALSTAHAQISDVSDSVWSIIVPTAAATDIVDMGQVLVLDTKDSLVNGYLTNTCNFPIRIDAIFIDPSSDAEGNFGLASGTPFVLSKPGEQRNVDFWFRPKSTGVKNANVIIYTQADTLIKKITGVGVLPQIEIGTTLVDFGQVKIKWQKDTIVTAVLCNKGSGVMTFSGITLLGPDKAQFFILSGTGGFTLAPGHCDSIKLRFKPTQPGRTSGRVGFYYTGVGSPAIVNLFGEGLGVQGFATLGLDTIRAKAGELVEVPVYLVKSQDLDLTGATGFYSELRFNSTLLSPFGGTPKGATANGVRTIALDNIPVLADAQGLLTKFQFIAMLGDQEGTPLTLQNSFALNGKVALTEIPGYFLLTDVCHEGGTRLFTATGRVNLFQNRPNPFNAMTVIDYEVIEIGHTRLVVMDMYGRTVATLVDEAIQPGRYAVSFDASTLPSGTYMTILQTPTLMMFRLMEVVK